MQFVVTEKNFVARSIAAVLGARQKKKGYLEGNGYWVSWCVGHLVELAAPSEYDEKYTKWQAEDLPILPKDWQYAVIENTKAQFNVLRTLMNDSRVTSIVCATDAGREGELIFRLVYSLCGCTKPVERLWISSLEDAAIAEGFRNLRPASEYDSLYHAALCRAQADWLVGINATRLFSTRYHQLLNIGRVMTPTLALLVEREAQIQAFRSTPFYTVQLDCGSLRAISERLTERAEAERIAALCDGKEARIIKLEQKERLEQPPRLYDLTSLQRDANTALGFTASRTGVGISLDFWQAALVLLTALVTGVLAVRLVERRLVKKRFLPPEEKTEAQRKNDRLLRTTALTLCAALALSAFAARALVGFGDTRLLAEGVEFTDFDSFKRYMRKPVKPTYDSGGGFATETAVAESPLYYENDTPIYRSQTEGATIEDDNGNVLCNFIWRNRSVVFWRTGPKADGYLPVTVYTQEAMSLARQKAKHIDMVFYGVYAVEVVAAAAYYLRKREK